MNFVHALWILFRSLVVAHCHLAFENLALRHQLAVLHRTSPRPNLQRWDRWLWIWLLRRWSGWKSALMIVSPATVVRWHRQGYRWYWRRRSAARPGRPQIAAKIRTLIRRVSHDNPLWGAPRIQAELRLLGHEVAQSTVAKYMVRRPKGPSATWRTFLKNHTGSLAAIDFFVVPTITFKLMYVFVIFRHDRRRVAHFGVTTRPTPAWVAQQLRDAFAGNEPPRYLIRDHDGIYGETVQDCIKSLGIEQVLIGPRAPWQNPYVERLIGTLRRECLDHIIVLSETHLKRVLTEFFDYYHTSRTHQSLDDNSPTPRAPDPPEHGHVTAIPYLGGLHHRYQRAA
jgi:putative transposase